MNKEMVIILGAGGHTKTLLGCLEFHNNYEIKCIYDTNKELYGKTLIGIPIKSEEDEIFSQYSPNNIKLINGIGSIGLTINRKNTYLKFKENDFIFANVIHPTAYLSKYSRIGEGCQLITGSVIHPDSSIGNNVIINTNAVVEHDCHISDHVHIAPGAICCGGVTVGQGTHVGAGAIIIQGITIGSECIIGAGAVVTQNIVSGSSVKGVPARNSLQALRTEL